MTLNDISIIIGIIVSYLGVISFAIKGNNEKKALENRVNLNDSRIDSNKTLVIALKEEYKEAIDSVERNSKVVQENLLNEIKEMNKLLTDLSAHIIRFEERQVTQWKTLEKHSKKLEDLEHKILKR